MTTGERVQNISLVFDLSESEKSPHLFDKNTLTTNVLQTIYRLIGK